MDAKKSGVQADKMRSFLSADPTAPAASTPSIVVGLGTPAALTATGPWICPLLSPAAWKLVPGVLE